MKQAERIFMISDAAKRVEVEAHVLRYWEDELKLPVKRNEMGHRYYTKEDIDLFRKIKDWKEQGLQLKAIRNMLKNGTLKEPMVMFGMNTQMAEEKEESEGVYVEESGNADLGRRHVIMVKKGEVVQSSIAPIQEESREQKSFRLQQLLSEMIAQAVQSNNQELCQEIKESLLKELDYQFRLQEEKEDAREMQRVSRQEEHYRQIDELIRSHNPKGKSSIDKKAERQRAKEEKQNRKESKLKKDKEVKANREVKVNREVRANRGEMAEQEVGPAKEAMEEKDLERSPEGKEKKLIFIKRKRSIV